MIKGAIFDIDGTLLDSMPVWKNAGAEFLKTMGITAAPDLAERIFDLTFREGAELIRSEYELTLSPEEIESGVVEVIREAYCGSVPFKPGIKDVLEEFRSKNVRMTLATSGSLDLALPALKRLGVSEYFENALSASEMNTTKYKPDIYYKCAEIMGTKPSETMVFEDAVYAVKTSKEAGFCVTAVYDEASKDDWNEIKKYADETIIP